MALNETLKRYAITLTAFILDEMQNEDLKRIRNIILFGSVATATATPDSDIDLFFDTTAPPSTTTALKKRIKCLADAFSLTNTGITYKLKGITNTPQILTGNLDQWDLKDNISGNSIVLYGTYQARIEGPTPHLLIWWDAIKKNRGSFLNTMYGYTARKKRYPGILERTKSLKIGKSAILIPAREKDTTTRLLEKHQAEYHILKISL